MQADQQSHKITVIRTSQEKRENVLRAQPNFVKMASERLDPQAKQKVNYDISPEIS